MKLYTDLFTGSFTWANDYLNMDDFYIFNKKFYKQNNELYAEINPECILQTSVVLPFVLPINENAFTIPFFSMRDNARSSLTLYFSQITDEKTFSGGFIQNKGIRYNTKRTRIEINAIFIEDYFILKDKTTISILNIAEAVRQAKYNDKISSKDFMDCTRYMFEIETTVIECALKFINSLIMSYAKNKNDTKVYCIDKNQVEWFTHFRIIEPKKWNTYNWLHMNNIDIPNIKADLNSDEIGKIFHSAYSEHGSNFEEFTIYYQKALFRFSCGEMSDCIILLVISTEILVKKVIEIYYQKKEKKEVEEIEEILSENSFKNLLNNILPQIIGGNWNLTSDRNVPGKWYSNTYKLRGRIVHRGYNPEYMEAKTAIETTQEMHGYIVGLLRKRKKKMGIILDEFKSPYI